MMADAQSETVPGAELVDSLVQLTFAVHGVLARAAAEQGLSVTQLRLLGILRDRTPPMTAIAEHLGLDRSSITGLVDRAEQRGHVSRVTSIQDARVTVVRATPAGLAVDRKVVARVTAALATLIEGVSGADRQAIERVAAAVLRSPLEPGPARPGQPA